MTHITFTVKGGLGNQLFIYFASLYFSKLKSKPINLNFINNLYVNSRCDSILQYQLAKNIKKITQSSNLESIIFRNIGFIKGLSNKNFMNYLMPQSVYFSSEIGYDSKIEYIKSLKFVDGYFQSWRYYYSLSTNEKALNQLTKSVPLQELEKLAKKVKPIIVHARRGDYKKLRYEFGVLSDNYFLSAFTSLPKNLKKHEIWIFSDDPKYGKHLEYVFGSKSHYIETKNNLKDFEILELMRLGIAHIISNSSFSYWGAMLSDSTNHVLYPKKWFRGRNDPRDLIPENWKPIKSEWW